MEAFLVSTMIVGLAEIGDKTQILSLRIQLSSSGNVGGKRERERVHPVAAAGSVPWMGTTPAAVR
jgi:hypothetical protein